MAKWHENLGRDILHLRYLQPSSVCGVHPSLEDCGDTGAEDYRIDSETGACIKEGWVFLGGMFYLADEERAQGLCQRLWGLSLEDAYDDASDDVYYTEW